MAFPPPPRDPELIAKIADDLPVGIWVGEAEAGVFAYANRAFEEIMGRPPVWGAGPYGEALGIRTPAGEIYPEERLPYVQALRTGRTVVVDDLVVHRADGSRVCLRAWAKPFADVDGRVTHVLVAFTDITREVETGLAARQAEERLREVVSGAPVVLFAIDRDLRYTLMDGAGMLATGRPTEEFLGRHVSEAFPDTPEMVAGYERVLAGESVTREVSVGKARFESRITPLRDAAGAVIGGIGVWTDVTARHHMHERLLRAERMASLGTLSACIAHEVNNPLFAATASLELLEHRLGPTASGEVRDLLQRAQQAIERVQGITNGLRTFSRMGDRPGDSADIHQVIEAAIGLAWNQLRHRARVVKRYGEVHRVRGNEGRLAQVFLNLLVNAAQAIPEGQADRHEVTVVTSRRGHDVVIEVRDTGCGVPSQHLERIFERFYSTKPIGIGSGLGLAICREIVTTVGGSMEVESEPDQGSTFRVVLPAADPAPAERPAAGALTAGAPPASVLVLDDDPMIRELVQRLLSSSHHVRAYDDARQALAAMEAGERFDVIVCDVMMPELTGMDVYERLRAVAPDQAERIVFMTGGTFTSRARAFMAGVTNPRLDKPFTSRALHRAVSGVLERRRASLP